jgi:hypothetical protein
MSDPHAAPRPLPDRPNLRHLKDQAKDLVKAGAAKSITDAQFKIATRVRSLASIACLSSLIWLSEGSLNAGFRGSRPVWRA